MIKLKTTIGVLKLDVYCVVHYFKQERGQKRVINCIIGNTKWIQHRFLKSFVFQLGRISHSVKD